jgi:hypothetical protein
VEPPTTCQSCRQAATEARLAYRRGAATICHEALLQCDVCERFACAECLRVYDILSGYDFLCDDCARELQAWTPRGRGH